MAGSRRYDILPYRSVRLVYNQLGERRHIIPRDKPGRLHCSIQFHMVLCATGSVLQGAAYGTGDLLSAATLDPSGASLGLVPPFHVEGP